MRARARVLRRRRTTLRSVAAAAVVVSLGLSVPAVWARVAPVRPVVGGPVGQPIALWLHRDAPPVVTGNPPGYQRVAGSTGDIAAQLRTVAGRTTVVPVSAPRSLNGRVQLGPAPLPGGGLATIGHAYSDVTPGPGRARRIVETVVDGRRVSTWSYEDNSLYVNRPVPLAGSRTTLYWWSYRTRGRDADRVLVVHDIATGRSRVLAPAFEKDRDLPYFGMQATDQRIISWPTADGPVCSADVAAAGTGEHVATIRPRITGCTDVYFALAPDDKLAAAMVTDQTGGSWSQRVFVVDPRTGDIKHRFDTPPLAAGTDRSTLLTGIDWADGRTLRYARAGSGPEPLLLTYRW